MKKMLVSLAVAALTVPAFAQTAPQRIAVIDVQKVLAQSAAGKATIEKLKKMQDDRIARAKSMDDEVKKIEGDLSTKRLSLSEDKIQELGKQLNDKKIAMQRFAQDADREVGEARDRELMALEARIKPIIDALGKEMGLAVIFNKYEAGLVYAADAIDITEPVVKRFNEANPAAAAAAAVKK